MRVSVYVYVRGGRGEVLFDPAIILVLYGLSKAVVRKLQLFVAVIFPGIPDNLA